jgi:hypothetical protein
MAAAVRMSLELLIAPPTNRYVELDDSIVSALVFPLTGNPQFEVEAALRRHLAR